MQCSILDKEIPFHIVAYFWTKQLVKRSHEMIVFKANYFVSNFSAEENYPLENNSNLTCGS